MGPEAFSSLPSWPCLPYPWLLPMPSPRLKLKLSPSTTMVERRMDLTTPTTEETDTTTRDTMDSMDTTDTMDSTDTRDTTNTMDSTTDSTTPVSKPKAGNYRFQILF